MTLNELKSIWNISELAGHTECIETALEYYQFDNSLDPSEQADSFIEWYTEEYIHHAEVIYYSNAMEFLIIHDVSLRDSMVKAEEYGYTPSQLNSELLASLLLQDILLYELKSMRDELIEYFENLIKQ